MSDQLNPKVKTWQMRAGVVGVLAAAGMIVLAFFDPAQAWQSYIYAYVYFFALSIGGMGFLMIHHLVSGRWGFITQRFLEAKTRNLWLMAVLFVPILFYMDMYPWTDPWAKTHLPDIVEKKTTYLNVEFFLYRAAAFWAIFLLFAWLLTRWSDQQDSEPKPENSLALMRLSAVGALVVPLAVTFASVDWTMSLEPEWFSSIYGLYYLVGGGLCALAVSIIMFNQHYSFMPLAKYAKITHFHHLGNLLLGFTVLWAYVSFAQFVIIWSANLPEETPFYLNRTADGLQMIAIFSMIFHFAVPFLILLQRNSKRITPVLRTIAVWMLLVRAIDLWWVIKPAFGTLQEAGETWVFTYPWQTLWVDVLAFVAVGGIWFYGYCYWLNKRPLLVNDLRMADAFARDLPEHHHHPAHKPAAAHGAAEHA